MVHKYQKVAKHYLLYCLFLGFLFAVTISYSQCPTPPGDQNTAGTTGWIGYLYSFGSGQNPPSNNPFAGTYNGFVTESENFNRNLGNGGYPVTADLCVGPVNSFAVRYKLNKTYANGSYQITVGGDDGYRLFINGILQTTLSNWNDHAYVTSTDRVVLNGATELILEYYESGGGSRVSFDIATTCSSNTTAPTSITGTSTICVGDTTTLTAAGGTLDSGAFYEWGTGTTVGGGTPVTSTTNSITVSPTSTQNYWVRRVDAGRCFVTNGVAQEVTVNVIPTAPTAITGNIGCVGVPITLRATGGQGGRFQWGTGTTVGTTPISGANNATLNILSPVAGTHYWVQRLNQSPCAATATTGVSTTITLNTVQGNETDYGVDSWIGYVYNISGQPPTNFNANYRGFVTRPFTFDQDFQAIPLTGPDLCGGPYNTDFAVRFRMRRTMPAGTYTITVGGDDGFRLSVDGGATFITDTARWASQAYTINTVTVPLSGVVNFVLEYYQGGSGARLSFNICSTAPTGISGTNPVCSGSSTTLTAIGGVASSTVTYQWGTGTVVGSNIITGATGVSLTASPLVNTTYWVRRMNLGSCAATSGTTQLVTVSSSTVAGTITGSQTVCLNSAPLNNITLSGNTGNVLRWERSTDSAFLSPLPTIISNTSTTLTGANIGIVSAPTYIRAVVQQAGCSVVNSNAVLLDFESTTWNGNWSNGVPTLTKSVIIDGNFTIPNTGINACSVTVSSIGTLTISSNNFLLIQNNLQNNGTINIENNGSLVQISNTAVNTGTINYTRTATAEQFDVIYWSSPVATKNLSAIPKQSGNTVWQWNPTIPNGNGTYNFGNWEGASGNMTPGRGYAARVPNNTPTTPSPITTTFVGVPNNGLVEVQIARASNQATVTTGVNGVTFTNFDDNWNLIGNPYPSAIRAIDFLTQNSNLEGSVSLWTHGTSPFTSGAGNSFYGGFTYNYSSSDYLVYNSSGSQSGIGTFDGFIAAGQGFFIKMVDGAAITSSVNFNNSMRGAANRNDQFFRTKNAATDTANNGRIWLDLLVNNRPEVSRILIGYIDGATNAKDRMFDASGGYQSAQAFYSLIGNEIFGIQGKALPFESSDVVPLGMGLRTANPAGYKIAIAATDGLFANNRQIIYLEDKKLNIVHNLSASPYNFTAMSGIDNSRFALRYTNATLSLNNQTVSSANVLVFKDNGTMKVVSPAENIASVTIFDILGRSIYTNNKVNSNNFESTTLSVSQQTLIVKVVLENGNVVSRKMIF